MTAIQAPTARAVMTLVMMAMVLYLATLTIVMRPRGAIWCWASGRLLMVRLAMVLTAVDSSESQRQQMQKSSKMQRFARWEIAQVWCAARGFAELTAKASDANIPRVVARVLRV
jgi:hypothetical protein